jgi:hypothetical protein
MILGRIAKWRRVLIDPSPSANLVGVVEETLPKLL